MLEIIVMACSSVALPLKHYLEYILGFLPKYITFLNWYFTV